MRLLLDTNAFWWWAYERDRVSRRAVQAVVEATEAYVSLASLWEIAIKTRIGKMRGSELLDLGLRGLEAKGLIPLTIDYRHILGTMELPLYHRDPFDRLLLAQARTENLMLVTSDITFERYGVECVW